MCSSVSVGEQGAYDLNGQSLPWAMLLQTPGSWPKFQDFKLVMLLTDLLQRKGFSLGKKMACHFVP